MMYVTEQTWECDRCGKVKTRQADEGEFADFFPGKHWGRAETFTNEAHRSGGQFGSSVLCGKCMKSLRRWLREDA